MYIIDVALKLSPLPVSVQRKSAEDAEALYQEIVEAMRTGHPQILEIACDQVPDKKVSLLSSEICAIQKYQKSSTTAASGRAPGFAAALVE
ncbi:hypothetical protein [Kamptonema formosum]|uniref:hypothetical protein n=1 Tax=Kamptonema formosum TaxID=331992 RepID=UPI0003461310|nr:hypothetical protein [Oscillatoria sp. PCC 10802]